MGETNVSFEVKNGQIRNFHLDMLLDENGAADVEDNIVVLK